MGWANSGSGGRGRPYWKPKNREEKSASMVDARACKVPPRADAAATRRASDLAVVRESGSHTGQDQHLRSEKK